MAMPQQTEIIRKLRVEVAELKSHNSKLLTEIQELNEEIDVLKEKNETLTSGNLKLQEAMEHNRQGLQADLDGSMRAIQSLRLENTKLRTERDEARATTTEEVALVESTHFDDKQDLLKGLEKVLIALGRSK